MVTNDLVDFQLVDIVKMIIVLEASNFNQIVRQLVVVNMVTMLAAKRIVSCCMG